jgi:hypothetical protein
LHGRRSAKFKFGNEITFKAFTFENVEIWEHYAYYIDA